MLKHYNFWIGKNKIKRSKDNIFADLVVGENVKK